MNRHHPSDLRAAWLQHRWLNRLQTGLLILTLVGIAAAAGSLLFGESGLWLALFAVAGTLLLEPAAASVPAQPAAGGLGGATPDREAL